MKQMPNDGDGEHLAADNLLCPHPHCFFKHHNGILSNLPEIGDHHLEIVVERLFNQNVNLCLFQSSRPVSLYEVDLN